MSVHCRKPLERAGLGGARQTHEQALTIKALVPNRPVIVETIPPLQPELHRETLFLPRGSGTLLLERWQLDLGIPRLLEPAAAARV
jgi:hypothetical protein